MSAPTSLSLHEQLARECIHFNGVMNDTCKAGIKYADVRVDKPYKFPCLKQGGECPHAKFRTEEEVNKEVAEMNDQVSKTLTTYFSIKAHYEKLKERSGKLPCQCGGELHYAVASTNGHIWAKCSSCGIAFNE